jgi:hypothetical protein
MIDTLYLANYIQYVLNQNSFGLDFLIFADEGDLVATRKIGNQRKSFVQGLVEITSSTIVPVKNLTFHTINAQLMILADLTDAGFIEETNKKRKQSRNLLNVKECLAEMIGKLNGLTTTFDDGDKTYNVTIGMSRATDGQKDSLGHITEFLPLYMNISFNLFENGVNTNNIKLIVNHENLHFTRIVLSKIKTADQNNFAKDKGSKTLALIGGKGIDLILPVLQTDFGKIVMEDFIDDNSLNRAIDVRLETPLGNSQFIGILGNTQISGDIGLNLGYNVSIVQGVEKLLKYDENWQKILVPIGTKTKTIDMNKEGTIYWGDGTSDYVTEIKSVTHTYTDTTKPYTIIKFGG